MVMRSFLLFRGSQPGLFYDLSTGESLPPPHSLPTSRERMRLPPLISREKDSGLPPVTTEKTSCPFRHRRLFDALSSNILLSISKCVRRAPVLTSIVLDLFNTTDIHIRIGIVINNS